MRAVRLRTEMMENPTGMDILNPFLSWACEGGMQQTAYRLMAKDGAEEIWDSGLVKSSLTHLNLPAALHSGQQISWQVMLWDENEQPGQWSDCAFFEMGLLEKSCWQAKWICPEPAASAKEKNPPHQPASYLKKSFNLSKILPTRLYITCHGIYEAFINGKRVGNFVLAPGTGGYNQQLTYQTYDVTDLLAQGENELTVVLGDGWYRGCSGVSGDRNLFGSDLALLAQLEVQGQIILTTDETWQASQSGPIRENDLQQGECYDARLEEIQAWHNVRVLPLSYETLHGMNTVPILEHERFEGKLVTTPNGERMLDFGQNLAGYVAFSLKAHAGDTITLWHGEALDENGNFTQANFQPGPRHKEGGIRQQITYTCKGGLNHYKPTMTIMGFRYAKVETDITLDDAQFTAIAVYSKMAELAAFESSNALLNQLMRNSIWSQKGNFCDIPTDCPTRERAGWTGDAGVFVETGLTLMDCGPIFRKWLNECRLIQRPDGRVSNIAPMNGKPSLFTGMLSGSVGWGDACILVPFALYKRYGNKALLRENYPMMQRWYAYLEKRARRLKLNERFQKNPYKRFAITTGIDYGEWCEPGVGVKAVGEKKKSVGTAYLYYSGKLLAQIAQILGEQDDAAHYRNVSEQARKAYQISFTKNGRILSPRQCEYVRALEFGLLDETDSIAAAKDLNELVCKNDYHLNTGFLSTPFLCKVLTAYGYTETAYRLLLNESKPSWLYAVKKGATTIWENWDSIDEDGKVHASLNHYAYGVISGWLVSGVCGIQYAFDGLTIAPHPHPALQFAKATYDSPSGLIESGWRYENGAVKYHFCIPANVTANIILPDGRKAQYPAGSYDL